MTTMRRPKSAMVSSGAMVVMSPIQKPVIIAESSAQALTRHQNQRKMSTTPGRVPMAMTSRRSEERRVGKEGRAGGAPKGRKEKQKREDVDTQERTGQRA